MQQIDVVEAVFGDEGPPLDLEKMAILGKEAAGVGVAAIVGAFLLFFSSLFFTQSKSPLKEQPVENIDPGVCLSGKCANGAKNVKALEFTSDRFADDRNAARAENPRSVTVFVSLRYGLERRDDASLALAAVFSALVTRVPFQSNLVALV